MFQPNVFATKLRLFSIATCVAAVIISALALIGWVFDIALLKSFVVGQVSMNPLTAVCFLLAAHALWLLNRSDSPIRLRYFARACALFVVMLATLRLLNLFDVSVLAIDRLLFSNKLGDNRMAPNTAVAFLLLGLSLVLIDVKTRRGHWPTQWLTLLVAAGSFLSLVGYLYDAQALYGVASYIPMACNTAIALHVLSLGILCSRPDQGVIKELSSEHAGGVLARLLLPAAIVMPLGLGWLRMAGQNAGLYDMAFGAALMVAFSAVMLVGLIWRAAVIANRTDAERDHFFNLSLDLLCIADVSGYFRRVNRAFTTTLGYTAEELTSKPLIEFVHPNDREATETRIRDLASGSDCINFENRFRRKDGSWCWLSWTCPAPAPGDERLFSVGRDITESKAAHDAIQRLNAELEDRVLARTAELTAANWELAQKNQENEMFVYSVSHDLRSPLVNLQGFSQELSSVTTHLRDIVSQPELPSQLRERGLGLIDDEMTESIRFIQTSVTRLSRIIDALLRLSRIGRIEYQWQSIHVQNVVATVITSMAGTIDEKGADITVAQLPNAWGDPTAVEQVFANLIGNALNYLDPTRLGRIEIGSIADGSLGSGNEGHTYYVRDNGLGIPEAHRPKLFQAFQRLHPHVAQGEGMGLATVRRIVDRHSGRIWVESTAGGGSTFFVTLPARAAKSRDTALVKITDKERGGEDARAISDFACGR